MIIHKWHVLLAIAGVETRFLKQLANALRKNTSIHSIYGIISCLSLPHMRHSNYVAIIQEWKPVKFEQICTLIKFQNLN